MLRLWKKDFWSEDVQKRLFWICVGGVLLLMLILNFFTPMVADDYSYSLNRVTRERIASFQDILESQYNHYFTWGGRNVVHTLAQLFLWIGKPFFTVMNSIAYTAFSLVLYAHANCGSGRKYQPFLYLLINLALWFAVPVFGQTTLWLVGSCNYLWGSLIIFSFLLPYRYALQDASGKGTWWKIPVWLLLGILAGWCNENTSGMAVMLTVLFLVRYVVRNRKVPIWGISGLIGVTAGFVIMILAPGNYARSDLFVQEQSTIRKLIAGFETCTDVFWENLLPLSVLFAALYMVFLFGKGDYGKKLVPLFYFLGAMACNYAMMLAPIYPYRAEFGTISALIVACGSVITGLQTAYPGISERQTVRAGVSAVLGCSIFLFCISYAVASMELSLTWRDTANRDADIQAQIVEGNRDIVVDSIAPDNPNNPLYQMEDIQPDPNHWVNLAVARYYGIDSIRTAE